MILLLFLLLCALVLALSLALGQAPRKPFPRKLFQTWKSKEDIPRKMAYWSSTWKDKNPSYEYILWDDADNLAFVKEKFPWFLPTYQGYDVEIKRADAIRYMFLYTYGGIYVDMDFECLKPLDELLDTYSNYDIILGSIDVGVKRDAWHLSNNIPNAIMISKPGCEFWIDILKSLQLRAKTQQRVESTTGPIVLKECYLRAWTLGIKVLEPSVLYPISWVSDEEIRIKSLSNTNVQELSKEMAALYPNSYAVTYWTHSW